MHSRIGNIRFNGLNTPLSFKSEKKSKLARIQKVYGKDSLQKVGDEPDMVTISIRLHNAWIRIEDAIEQIEAYKESGEVVEYIDGQGRSIGSFAVDSFSQSDEAHFADGSIVSTVIELSLIESAEVDQLTKQEVIDKDNAFASNPNNTLPIFDVLTGTTVFAAVSLESNSADISAKKAIEQLQSAQVAPSQRQGLLARARNGFKDTAGYLEGAIDKVQNTASIIASAPNLLAQLQDMADNVDTMIERIDQGDYSNAYAQSLLLSGSLNGLPNAILPLQLDLILRNG